MTAVDPSYICGAGVGIGKEGTVLRTCIGALELQRECIDVGPDGYEWRPYACGLCQRVTYNVDEDPSATRCEPEPTTTSEIVGPIRAYVEHVDRGGGVDNFAAW